MSKPSLILFDLDGTLLPLDQDAFLKLYFSALAKKVSPYGYEPDKLVHALWKGVGAMVANDGTMTNDARFWETFSGLLDENILHYMPVFEDFYRNEFHMAKDASAPAPLAKDVIAAAKDTGAKVVLATNPLFPVCAVETRLSWIDLTIDDFDYVTTYETNRYCKPNPAYYRDILTHIGTTPEQTLMIGNDINEDILPTQSLGIASFLLTDCVIWEKDKESVIPGGVPAGNYAELLEFLKKYNQQFQL